MGSADSPWSRTPFCILTPPQWVGQFVLKSYFVGCLGTMPLPVSASDCRGCSEWPTLVSYCGSFLLHRFPSSAAGNESPPFSTKLCCFMTPVKIPSVRSVALLRLCVSVCPVRALNVRKHLPINFSMQTHLQNILRSDLHKVIHIHKGLLFGPPCISRLSGQGAKNSIYERSH